MKIIVTGPEYYGYSDSICYALRELGYEVIYYPMREFYVSCPYWQRKLYKLGMGSFKDLWERKWQSGLTEIVSMNVSADTRLLCCGGVLHPKVIADGVIKAALYTWDNIREKEYAWLQYLKNYERIYIFEKRDIAFLRKAFRLNSQYMPLGYDSRVYMPQNIGRDIDVSFIGSITGDRLSLLEDLAEFANDNNLVLYVGGPWYDRKNWLRKRRFVKRHPLLAKYIDNRAISQREVALIYSRSKICLNINQSKHKSLNPRTFEILATKSFQLMNSGQDVEGVLTDGYDLCLYDSKQDLFNKIMYYITNVDVREKIAVQGYCTVIGKYSMTRIMETIVASWL